jgi:hypothetical protein
MSALTRRRLLGLVAMLPFVRAAQAQVSVGGGVPHQLPLAVVDDLVIEQPALVDDQPARLAVLSLGALQVASGRIAGVDALLLESVPYAQAVPNGLHPVQLVLAGLPDGEERVALMQVKFADRPAKRWENALLEGEDAAALGDDELSVFAVESGVAALFDAGALAVWRSELAREPGALAALERVLRENRRPVWTWARVLAGNGGGVLATAGMGNGEYAAYWGRDAAGELVSLVLDFDLLDWAALPADEPVTT